MESDIESRMLALEVEIMSLRAQVASSQDNMWLSEEPLTAGSGEGAGGSGGCFAIAKVDTDARTVKLVRCYYAIGGMMYEMTDQTVEMPTDGGYVALLVEDGASSPVSSVKTYSSASAMRGDMRNPGKYVVPLYKFDDGSVSEDLRDMPVLMEMEYYEDSE